ncbi:MAG: hypothetical protein ACJAZO_000165 [Myxococcota bacterium]|jgi:hypothetical protein
MTHPLLTRTGLVLVAVVAAGAACTRDDNITSDFGNKVAVVAGDFDDVSAPLKRMDARHELFEGLISNATWDVTFNPDNVDLKVEDLFIGSEGAGQMSGNSAIFVGSGTRGFGDRQYNGLDNDDQLIQDIRTLDNTSRYVERGGPLLVTDWAYELVDAIWPDAMTFIEDDPSRQGTRWVNLDLAQLGVIDNITAEIVDDDLAAALGSDTMGVDFPYSNFAVIESVGPDVTVHVRGDVSYRPDELAEPIALTGVPLLVSFQPFGDNGGTVYYSTFHVDAQNAALMDEMLLHFFGDFEVETTNANIE